MFSGIQEILVLVIIILAIFFLPRILSRGNEKPAAKTKPVAVLSGKMRSAIAATVLWPAVIAAFIQPWNEDLILYLYLGVGPVAVIWIIYWVYIGFRKK
jgi:predicted Na+-dependent transporter